MFRLFWAELPCRKQQNLQELRYLFQQNHERISSVCIKHCFAHNMVNTRQQSSTNSLVIGFELDIYIRHRIYIKI